MIYWTGDASDQAVLKDFGHPALQENIDLIFCVSNWHRQSFIDAFHLVAWACVGMLVLTAILRKAPMNFAQLPLLQQGPTSTPGNKS